MIRTHLPNQILDLLAAHNCMALATLRADGFPQTTTVGYVNEGLMIYFGCSGNSQKARNIEGDNRVSLAINRDYDDWNKVQGLSMGGVAERLTDLEDIARIAELFTSKFPQVAGFKPEDLLGTVFFKVTPKAISVIDYTKRFGHSDLIIVD
jgi:general stress protein 26